LSDGLPGLEVGLGPTPPPIGHTVVVTLTSVVTEPTGQLATVGGHLVMVYVFVTETVLVV
jgi:hypothetical protein